MNVLSTHIIVRDHCIKLADARNPDAVVRHFVPGDLDIPSDVLRLLRFRFDEEAGAVFFLQELGLHFGVCLQPLLAVHRGMLLPQVGVDRMDDVSAWQGDAGRILVDDIPPARLA